MNHKHSLNCALFVLSGLSIFLQALQKKKKPFISCCAEHHPFVSYLWQVSAFTLMNKVFKVIFGPMSKYK